VKLGQLRPGGRGHDRPRDIEAEAHLDLAIPDGLVVRDAPEAVRQRRQRDVGLARSLRLKLQCHPLVGQVRHVDDPIGHGRDRLVEPGDATRVGGGADRHRATPVSPCIRTGPTMTSFSQIERSSPIRAATSGLSTMPE
jgi:hypothetical protein